MKNKKLSLEEKTRRLEINNLIMFGVFLICLYIYRYYWIVFKKHIFMFTENIPPFIKLVIFITIGIGLLINIIIAIKKWCILGE
jgi:hypothetical protein